MKVITPAVVLFVMVLVTSGSSNPVFRVPVTCGYSAERGYIVSKKAFVSNLRGLGRKTESFLSCHEDTGSYMACFDIMTSAATSSSHHSRRCCLAGKTEGYGNDSSFFESFKLRLRFSGIIESSSS